MYFFTKKVLKKLFFTKKTCIAKHKKTGSQTTSGFFTFVFISNKNYSKFIYGANLVNGLTFVVPRWSIVLTKYIPPDKS